MARSSKRARAHSEIAGAGAHEALPAAQAFAGVTKSANTRFKETVDVAVNLGIDSRKSEQLVSGSALLPHGSGRQVRVAVFAQGPAAQAATEAGADVVGFEDLAAEVEKGNINFDRLIAAPDAMPLVGKLGRILGPKGLMPNPKMGTVTTDTAKAVSDAKGGQVQFRVDKKGAIIHCPIGKASFSAEQLQENLESLLRELTRLKPATSRGTYLKKITVSSTMGTSFLIEQSSLSL